MRFARPRHVLRPLRYHNDSTPAHLGCFARQGPATGGSFAIQAQSEARGVFYLMRLNFLGGQERRKFWVEHRPTHLFVLSRRPAFVSVCQVKGCGAKYPLDYSGRCEACGGPVGPGTDATEYAWFGWDRLGVCRRKPGIYWI